MGEERSTAGKGVGRGECSRWGTKGACVHDLTCQGPCLGSEGPLKVALVRAQFPVLRSSAVQRKSGQRQSQVTRDHNCPLRLQSPPPCHTLLHITQALPLALPGPTLASLAGLVLGCQATASRADSWLCA